jgi:hypothetical protein
MRTKFALLLSLLAIPALAQPGQVSAAPFTIAETGQGFARLEDAVASVGDRDATIMIAAGRWRDCAVQDKGRITYRAASPGNVFFDGGVCEGKGTLVLRGRGAVVEGIIFENVRVPDRNGAGIRIERGPLVIRNSMFRNSEQGILSADDPASSIVIEDTTFSRLGRCDGDVSCAHAIYIGGYGTLTVRRSRFEAGNGGHYIKSWTPKVEVTDSSFDDTRGRATNYMIDLSGGAIGLIARNRFVGGANKENRTAMITVAPEARQNRAAGLVIKDNVASLAPGVSYQTSFVADWSREPLQIGTNQLGAGIQRLDER